MLIIIKFMKILICGVYGIEKQLNFRNYNDAYIIIKTVCTNKKYSLYNKSLILWSLYVDLESVFWK